VFDVRCSDGESASPPLSVSRVPSRYSVAAERLARKGATVSRNEDAAGGANIREKVAGEGFPVSGVAIQFPKRKSKAPVNEIWRLFHVQCIQLCTYASDSLLIR
jgi:hypothetical protein